MHTGIVVSVVAVPFCTSFSAPPFSVTSILRSGRNATAVGLLRPDAMTCSLKLAGGVADAGTAASSNTNAAAKDPTNL